jgi:hypothetical protein
MHILFKILYRFFEVVQTASTLFQMNAVSYLKSLYSFKLRDDDLEKLLVVGFLENHPNREMLENGYEIVYEKKYSVLSLTSELRNIESRCGDSTILCAGALNVPSDSLKIVACENCRNILRNSQTNNSVLVNSSQNMNQYVDWYFNPFQDFGFNSKEMSVEEGSLNSTKNICWFLDPDIISPTFIEYWDLYFWWQSNGYNIKYVYLKEINNIWCPPSWRVGFPVTCKLDLILNGLAEFNVTIDYGDNQTASFTSASRTFNITKTYQNVGEYLIRVEIPSPFIFLEKRVQILNRKFQIILYFFIVNMRKILHNLKFANHLRDS